MVEFLVFGLIIAAVVAFARLIDAKRRIELLEENVRYLRRELDRLLGLEPQAAPAEAAPAPEPHPAAQPAVAAEEPAGPEPHPVVPPPFVEPITELPAAAFSPIEPEPEPPQAPTPYAPPPQSTIPSPRSSPFDWENLVGVKLFSWVAGVALVLAAVFFLKYSVDHGWLSPAVRATLGLITGVGLLAACELRVARNYRVTANALDAAGIAILYATLFSMQALWHLIPSSAAFGLMALVTAVAVLLSIRRESVYIALLGLVGGFATPALLSTGEDRPIALFSYLLLLNVGLAWVAYRKRWPVLSAMSLVLTVIYQWTWVGAHLEGARMPLAAAIFIAFALVAAGSLLASNKGVAERQFDKVAMAGAVLPLIFSIFAAAVPAYGTRFNVLFGYLLLVTAGLAAIARYRGPAWLHTLGGITTVATFAIWFATSYRQAAWPAILAWLAVFILFYLATALREELASAVYTAPALFFAFPLLAAIEDRAASPALLFGVTFVLLAAAAAFAVLRDRGLVYLGAAVLSVAAEAVWSARHLTADRLLPALMVYGAFALSFIAVPAIARRAGRELKPRGGVHALVFLSLIVLLFLSRGSVADAALWGLGVMLLLLNAASIVEAGNGRSVGAPAIAALLSWIVIAFWWSGATIGAMIVPALALVAVFTFVVLGGLAWLRDRDEARSDAPSYLAIVGHLFLLVVAVQPALAIPPWPLLAVLFVVTLAIGVASLYQRQPSLFTAAIAASQIVALAFGMTNSTGRWPAVAIGVLLAFSAMAIAWIFVARRVGIAAPVVPAVTALIGAQFFVAAISSNATSSLFATTLAAYALLVAATLVLAGFTAMHELAVISAVLGAYAVSVSGADTPAETLAFAGVIYAMFLAYPLVLGRRIGSSIAPHAAAVLASAAFFLAARTAIEDAGYGHAIGVLPVVQAALLLVLLRRLVTLEPPEARLMSRLALVAGAALAFVTVAIPLQLDKQWITIGWALEGAALVWLFRRIPHRGLLYWAGALLGAAFVRLVFNRAVFSYHPPSSTPVLNWYLYTYAVAAAAFFVAARLLPAAAKRFRGALNAGATVLLFLLLNIEIADFFSRGSVLTFNFFNASLAQDLTYTIGWAMFAIALLVAGIVLPARSARIAAIALLSVTILKCFLHDLARLGGLYRVGSLLGLALSLVLVGVLLQKFVRIERPDAPAPQESA